MGLKKETETSFQKLVCDYARLCKWKVAHFKPAMVPRKGGGMRWVTNGDYDAKGFPDLVLVKGGRIIFAELKSDAGQRTPEQVEWGDALSLCMEKMSEIFVPSREPVRYFVWRPADWVKIREILSL